MLQHVFIVLHSIGNGMRVICLELFKVVILGELATNCNDVQLHRWILLFKEIEQRFPPFYRKVS